MEMDDELILYDLRTKLQKLKEMLRMTELMAGKNNRTDASLAQIAEIKEAISYLNSEISVIESRNRKQN